MRKLSLVFLLAALGCPEKPDTGDLDTGESDWPELPEVDSAIADAMEAGNMPGLAAAIIAGGELAWVGAYGLADIENDRAVTHDTPFMLASVSKAVTAVAVMQAVEDGVVDLDQSVNELLSFTVDNPHIEGETITGRHLGTHSSGIIDNWSVLEQGYVEGDSPVALGDFLEGYLVDGGEYYTNRSYAASEPGVRYEYSNVGASLFGYLVEAASGTAFDDHCDARIFEVLGMEHSGWHLADHDVDSLAVPYEMRGGEPRAVAHYGYPDYPDGQLRSSVVDLAVFTAAVMNGGALGDARILSEALNAEMLTEQEFGGSGQGIIWYQWELSGRDVWGHNGGDTGVATEIAFDPTTGVGVLVLVNTDWTGAVTAGITSVQEALFEAGEGM